MSKPLVLTVLLLSTACITPRPDPCPGTSCKQSLQTPSLTAEQAQTRIADINQRYAQALQTGLDEVQCKALTEAYRDLHERDPKLVVARFDQAVVHEVCGQLDAAEAIYSELAVIEFPQALNNLGVISWRRGEYERALGLFERAIAADDTHAIEARNNLAMALRERYANAASVADFDEAQRQLQNILAVDSSNKTAYENLARLYYDRGRNHDPSYLVLAHLVVDQAQQVLEASGQHSADLHNIRGLLLMEDDDQVRALRAFRQAIEVEPEHIDANRNLAMIALRFRDYSAAERSLEAVLAADPALADPEAWIALGVSKRGLRKYDEAERAYRRALELDKSDPRPWYNLGILAQEHLSAQAEGDDMTAVYASARGHYETFLQVAGTGRRWRTEVVDANDRIAIIDDTIDTIARGKRIEEQYAEMLAREQQQRLERIERLRQLELSATSVGELPGE